MTQYPPGFSPGHEPLKKIPRRKKRGPKAVEFPSRKNVSNGNIRASSPLVAELLMVLEADPEVHRISSFPVEVNYEVYGPYGAVRLEKHIPEIGALMRDWTVAFMDAIPLADQNEHKWLVSRGARLNETVIANHSATYAIMDEIDLHQEPRRWNLWQMFRHMTFGDTEVKAAVWNAVLSLGFPTTIVAVGEAAVGCLGNERPDVDAVYQAVLALCRGGEIDLDYGVVFAPDSASAITLAEPFVDGRGMRRR